MVMNESIAKLQASDSSGLSRVLRGGWQCHLGLQSPNDSPSSIAGGAGGGRHLCSARAARHLIRSQGDHDAPRLRRHRRVPQGAEIRPRSDRDRARDAHAHLTRAQACGGHGYLLSSGLPEFELSYLANCTLEGDNYLIGQQTTRFLFKMLDQARSAAICRESAQICRPTSPNLPCSASQARRGEAVDPTCTYLEDAVGASRAVCSARRPEDFLNAEMQLEAYRQRSAHVLLRAENTIAAGRKKGLSADAALNGAMVEAGRDYRRDLRRDRVAARR